MTKKYLYCGRAPPTTAQSPHTLQHVQAQREAQRSHGLKTPSLKGFPYMHDTEVRVSPHVGEPTERTYTAQQIADQHSVKSVTVRTRWFNWLLKVAPEPLLKRDDAFTELANTLFAEFAQVDQRERPAWVADAKERYSSEWGSVGIVDCEVMPDNVGGTLALLSANNSALQQTIALQLEQCSQFIDQLNSADGTISSAEMEQAVANGTSRAIQLFQAEEAAKAQATHMLRQRRMNGGAS